ncbi:FecR family protein [Chitinophaga costaii]|uniref:FecR family protein n=1 Tax=Chitinophaga costaii TaxID=1335309 RepID=A0A1C4EFU9_9BACT|nr:FecR family protein [Chitinophaga costaii]PUZ23852.1 FecR family protein [Chitinophaga costaii]SCC42445.1 FecR family protein [Chitinophaga costaii]
MKYPTDMDKQFFFQLLERYAAGTASPEECVFAERYLEVLDLRKGPSVAPLEEELSATGEEMYNRLLLAIREEASQPLPMRVVHRVHFLRRNWWVAAAVLIVGILGGYIWYNSEGHMHHINTAQQQDVAPGRSGAVLTLADGSQVVLDSLHNGVVATQQGAQVTLHNGQLSYNGDVHTKIMAYNTMTTPRGRQYQLVLPDGTQVWLNAASSLTYPVSFAGSERKVSVRGEAYFEVAQEAGRPFRVQVSDGTEIQVLGTRFNINAYPDEASMNTTLLDGAVKVVTSGASQRLLPGEQAQVPHQASYIKLEKDVDVQTVMAWKEGSFAFHNADLPTVMRQLARWYDIEVRYEGAVPKDRFNGEIDRSLTLSQVLNGLARTSIHYKIENGNKLVIQP